MKAQGKLQDMLEILREHHLAPLVSKLVGVERNKGPAHDQKQPDPGGDERRELRPVKRAASATLESASTRPSRICGPSRPARERRGETWGEGRRSEPRLRGPVAHAGRVVELRIDPHPFYPPNWLKYAILS